MSDKVPFFEGEWRAHSGNNPDYIDIDAPGGRRVCSICLDTSDIAFDPAAPDDTPERELAERRANARLIEMAPGLYSLVTQLWSLVSSMEGRVDTRIQSLAAAGRALCQCVGSRRIPAPPPSIAMADTRKLLDIQVTRPTDEHRAWTVCLTFSGSERNSDIPGIRQHTERVGLNCALSAPATALDLAALFERLARACRGIKDT